MTIEEQPGFDPRLAWASEAAPGSPASARTVGGSRGTRPLLLSPVSLLGIPAGAVVPSLS
jgi:hypothetical protein